MSEAFLIVCDDSSHSGRPVELLRLTVVSRNGKTWALDLHNYSDAQHQRLLDNAPLSGEVSLDRLERFRRQGRTRARYRLDCGECNAVLVIKREKLLPIVKRAHSAGVSNMSIRGLRGIL